MSLEKSQQKPSFLLKGLSIIICLLPFTIKKWGAWILAILFYDIFNFRRKIVTENIKRVFPNWDNTRSNQLGRESFYHIWYNFFELLSLSTLSKKWIQKHVTYKGLEHLDEALKKNKGVLILSLHMGHGDMAISMIAHKGYPIHVISKHFKTKWANDFWFSLRRRFGAEFIDPHGMKTPFEILKALKQNHSVVFVLDQYMGPPYGVETTFFGEKTGTAYGLALFALKSGAPVIPVFGHRNTDGSYEVHFQNEIPFESKLNSKHEIDKDQTVLHMTQKYNFHLEKLILEYPKDWMWIHRRWKPFLSPPKVEQNARR